MGDRRGKGEKREPRGVSDSKTGLTQSKAEKLLLLLKMLLMERKKGIGVFMMQFTEAQLR